MGVTTSICGDAPELAKMVINKVKPEIETSDTIFGFLSFSYLGFYLLCVKGQWNDPR